MTRSSARRTTRAIFASTAALAASAVGCASPSPQAGEPAVVEVPLSTPAPRATPMPPAPPGDPRVAAIDDRVAQLQAQFEAAPPATDGQPNLLPEPVEIASSPTPSDAVVVVSEIAPLAAEPVVARSSVPPAEPAPQPATDAFEELPAPSMAVAPSGPTDVVLARLQSSPSSAVGSFDHRLLRLLAGDAMAGDMTFPGLRPGEERLVETVTDALVSFRRELAQSPDAEERVEPILEAADALRREVGLRLPIAELCSEVRLWGDYDPVDATFQAGERHRVVLYVEAEGFKSEQQPDGRWLTRLSLSAVLYDDEGRPVMSLPPRPAEDRSRRPRRDFFLSGLLAMPAHAVPGRHVLKVTVRDELAGRVAQQSVPVTFISG